MDRENWIEFLNIITMDDENIEKFKKLYGEGKRIDRECVWLLDEGGTYKYSVTFFSFSMVIPEPTKDESDANWFDKTKQDVWVWRYMRFPEDNSETEEIPEIEGINDIKIAPSRYPVSEMIGNALEQWRIDNWGTPSDVLYDDCEEPMEPTLDGLLKGEFPFYTFGRPPFKVYEKMATDGLVFNIKWHSPFEYDEWVTGKGQVVEGRFQYHAGPITGDEIMSIESLANKFIKDSKNGPNDKPTIVVKNREHLDQLLEELQEDIKTNLYMQGKFSLINKVSGNTIILNNVLDLNFLDVSNVTDLSNLSEYLDVSPCPDNGWFCKIKLDTSKWKK